MPALAPSRRQLRLGVQRVRDQVRFHLAGVLLALVAGLFAVLIHLYFFRHLSENADETAYLLQAQALTHGHLRFPMVENVPQGLDQPVGFLHPWLTGIHHGEYFTKYLPGYPLLLALSLMIFSTPVMGLAAAAAVWVLGVYFLSFSLFGSRLASLIAAAFVIASPIFIIHSAVYLSYAFNCGVLFLGLAAFWTGARCRASCHPRCARNCHNNCQSRFWLVIAGLIWGFALHIRPFDVVILVAPLTVLLLLWWGRTGQHRLRIVGLPLLGALPGIVVMLMYNAHVTGNPFLLPLAATDSLDALGFGSRRMLPGEPIIHFTPSMAWTALESYMHSLPFWMFGGLVSLILAVIGAIVTLRRLPRSMTVSVVALLVFPVFYFFFWGMDVSSVLMLSNLGPLYYLPMVTMLLIVAAQGAAFLVVQLYAWACTSLRLGRAPRLALTIALSSIVLLVSLVFTLDHGRTALNRQQVVTSRASTLLGAIPPQRALNTPAVVLITTPSATRYVGVPYQQLSNPYLDSQFSSSGAQRYPVVFAASQRIYDVRISQALPGRALYGLRLPLLTSQSPGWVPASAFVPLEVVQGPQLHVSVEVSIPAAQRCQVAYLILNGHRQVRPLVCNSTQPHTMPTSWTLTAAELAQALGVPNGLPVAGVTGSVIVGVASSDEPLPTDFEASTAQSWWHHSEQVEHRLSALVTGDAAGVPIQLQVLTPGVPWVGSPQPEAAMQRWDIDTTRTDVQVHIGPPPPPASVEPPPVRPLEPPTVSGTEMPALPTP